MLSPAEQSLYSRHLILDEVGVKGQEQLKQAKVLVIGAGGLGCPALQYLAAAGVGTIGIIDHDRVEESNLQRQILFAHHDVGRLKVEVAADHLQAINPFIQLIPIPERLTVANALSLIKEYDVVLDGSDNFETRYLLSDACLTLDKPLVYGSVLRWEGQVSVFNYRRGPSYRCLFPEPPEDAPDCATAGVLGVLPGIIGSLQANEVLKIILQSGEVLSGRLLLFDSRRAGFTMLEFERNEEEIRKIKLLEGRLDQINYAHFCKTKTNPTMSTIKEVTAEELKAKMDAGEDFQLIDVREAHEYEAANLGAELIPLATVSDNADKISRDKPVIIHCRSGARSATAIQMLQNKFGFTNLYNLKGGILAWQEMEK